MIFNKRLRSAGTQTQEFFNVILLIIFALFLVINEANADWNSGVTIEDESIRIAIDIDLKGVKVSINFDKSVIEKILANNDLSNLSVTDRSKLNEFAKGLVTIKDKQWLLANTEINASKSSYSIFFPFSSNQPQQIEIAPKFDLLETITKQYKVTVSHQGLPVIDHGVLTQAETLELDWQDPWYSHFLNPKLKRGHSEPTMAFLYINPQQIKSEIIVRIKEMAKWTDLGLRDETMIYPDEFEAVKQKVGDFLLAQNEVSVDAKTISAILDRVDYIRMGASDIQAYQPLQAQRQVATLIGVSLVQSVDKMPANVQWNWKLFNDKINRMAIRAYDPVGLFDSYVTPEHPVFEWENMLEGIDLAEFQNKPKSISVKVDKQNTEKQSFWIIGLIALLILAFVINRYISPRFKIAFLLLILLASSGCGFYFMKKGYSLFDINKVNLDPLQTQPILKQLLWNIYQAFESTEESVVYDQLAHSVNGALRETLYLQNRQAFLFQEGGQSKISEIKVQSIKPINDDYLFDCEWLVIGDVIHWGHQHRRENLYRAQIKLSPIENSWKIVELESIAQQRMD